MPLANGLGPTANELVSRAAQRLAGVGISTARLDARLIVADALGGELANLLIIGPEPVPIETCERIESDLRRREKREPLAQILGRKEFWSLPFAVNRDVLTPRPDSETLVECAYRQAKQRPRARILDLGTGSGCLLLALLSELPESSGIGIDIDKRAVVVAQENAFGLGLSDRAFFCVGNWTAPLAGGFDIIISNPPYIAAAVIDALEPEVAKYEPRSALDGGADGMAAYRALLPKIGKLMAPDGRFILEVGAGQAHDIVALARLEGLKTVATDRDIAGIERCVTLANQQQY